MDIRNIILTSLLLFVLSPVSAQTGRSTHGGALNIEVMVIEAKETGEQVDPELRSISALSRAPFSAYKSMRILGRQTSPAPLSNVQLPNGQRMDVSVLETIEERGNTQAYRVGVVIKSADQSTEILRKLRIIASKSEYFFIAGQRHGDGIIIIGVRVL